MSLLSFESLAQFWAMPAVHVNVLVFFNLVGALALGLVVGYERTYRGRAAGMRTYGLVCMASAALTVIAGYSTYWYGGNAANLGLVDPTRIIQGIVTGIGFLGAGIIMKDGYTISGLTTAASVWASSAIGILIGVGFYLAAILLTFLSVIFMMWGLHFESWLPARPAVAMMLRFKKHFRPDEETVRRIIAAHGYEIGRGSISITQSNEQAEWRFVAFSFGKAQEVSLVDLSHSLARFDALENYQLSHARN